MFSYIWPLAVIIISRMVYQVCAKGIPQQMNTYASMTITYAVATLFSAAAYFATSRGGNIFKEFSYTNWATIVLGVVITGLEVGFIFAYRAGWKVGILSTVCDAFLVVGLLILGIFAYHEQISWNKILGALICLAGIYFIYK